MGRICKNKFSSWDLPRTLTYRIVPLRTTLNLDQKFIANYFRECSLDCQLVIWPTVGRLKFKIVVLWGWFSRKSLYFVQKMVGKNVKTLNLLNSSIFRCDFKLWEAKQPLFKASPDHGFDIFKHKNFNCYCYMHLIS